MSDDKFRVRYMTHRRHSKTLEQIHYLLNEYLKPIKEHLGKDIVIEVVDCEQLTQERERRESAERALRFYSNKRNWSSKGVTADIDLVTIADYTDGFPDDLYGGKIAREHFREWENR